MSVKAAPSCFLNYLEQRKPFQVYACVVLLGIPFTCCVHTARKHSPSQTFCSDSFLSYNRFLPMCVDVCDPHQHPPPQNFHLCFLTFPSAILEQVNVRKSEKVNIVASDVSLYVYKVYLEFWHQCEYSRRCRARKCMSLHGSVRVWLVHSGVAEV